MSKFRKITVLLGLPLLAACVSNPPIGGAPGAQVTQVAEMPAPAFSDYAPVAQTQLIRPLDVMEVVVFGIEDLSREVTVGAGGTFDYPLIGTVNAMGRTPEEVSLEIEARFRETYVRNPDVTMRITERADQTVTVGGEVSRPGMFAITQPVTLMEAIALGGGMDEYAQQQEVLVFRTVGGERYIGVYDVRGIARGNYADPTIYPNDIVMVGESASRRNLELVLGVVSALGTPLVVIERALN